MIGSVVARQFQILIGVLSTQTALVTEIAPLAGEHRVKRIGLAQIFSLVAVIAFALVTL